MPEYVPFVNSETDCKILARVYKDVQMCRVSLESTKVLNNSLPPGVSIWLDPALDAYEHRLTRKWPDKPRRDWQARRKKLWRNLDNLFGRFSNYELLACPKNWRQQKYGEIALFVQELLNHCKTYKPVWLTVPQLPLVDHGSRNKINRILARATKEWKREAGFAGKLILPLIFTNQRQINRKPIREDKIDQAVKCYEIAEADGVWAVDSTLLDQNRNERFRTRYARLAEFHVALKKSLPPEAIKVAGPYWGINLVLWARGLCEPVAICLGSRYSYLIAGDVPSSPSSRIVIPPLRRWVIVHRELRGWLDKALAKLNPDDPARKVLGYIRENFDMLKAREAARKYNARFYKHWLDEISANPQGGRALALYQDLSAAFVVGSQLPLFPASLVPNSPMSVRKPGKVAEQLMLNCL
jgi:hypothetical protein